MEITISKLLSVVVALAYLIAFLIWGQPTTVRGAQVGIAFGTVILCVGLLFPLSLIWFPDWWGERTGRFTKETPPVMVAFGGWMLLVGLPIVIYLLTAKPAG